MAPTPRSSTSSMNGDEKIYDGHLFEPSFIPHGAFAVPEGLLVRPLHIDDYDKGFLEVLGQLTTVGAVSREQFEKRFRTMRDMRPKQYYVCVIQERSTGNVVGCATLVIELKFIHEAGCRGRVEDVVVDKAMRGRKLGNVLNLALVALAQKVGVYKLSLECKDGLIPFYGQFGYKKDMGNNFLVIRFDHVSNL